MDTVPLPLDNLPALYAQATATGLAFTRDARGGWSLGPTRLVRQQPALVAALRAQKPALLALLEAGKLSLGPQYEPPEVVVATTRGKEATSYPLCCGERTELSVFGWRCPRCHTYQAFRYKTDEERQLI